MTGRGDSQTDVFASADNSRKHGKSRKHRHQVRPCGGNTPNVPGSLSFTWETVEKSRGHRLLVLLNWAPVRTNTSGAGATMDRYIVQFERSLDEGVTRQGKTRKYVQNESTVLKVTAAVITSGTTAEFTLNDRHDLDTGDTVIVSGMTPGGYNGTWTVLSAGLTTTKFRANIGTSPGAGTAFGEAHEDVTSREIRGIRKHVWYRFRVQAVNTTGCRSDWSAWTSWTLANDHLAPPQPLLVTISGGTNRVVVEWDAPLVYLATEGTAGGTIGTPTLTGVGTFFNAQLGVGGKIRVGATGDVRTVTAIASDTSATLDANLSTTYSTQVIYLEETDPDVAYYDVWLSTTVGFTPPAYKRSRQHHSTRQGIKPKDADLGLVFYARVATVDASRNRSLWIPATVAGNSTPGVTPDGVTVGSGGGYIVATFTKPGRLRVRHYPYRWTNVTGAALTYKKARAVIGLHDGATHPNDGCPTGAAVNIQVVEWSADETTQSNLFAADSKLHINADTHKDSTPTTGFDGAAGTTLADDEQLSINIKQVGSTYPGEDLVLQVFMTP